MTDRRIILARIAELMELLEDYDIRLSCCTRCGEHPIAFSYAALDGDHPHITLAPDIDSIWIESDHEEEEEEEENETGNLWDPGQPQDEAWDQARNDWQKSQPSTGDPG